MKSKFQFILSMIIFGTIGVFVKYIDLSSSEIALVRGLIGSLFLTTVIIIMKKKIPWAFVKVNAVLLIASSIALSVNWIFFFEAFKHTTISNAVLSYYFAPVFVTILSPIVLKEKLSAKKIICIAIAMLGMLFIVGNGKVSASGVEDLIGIGYGLVAAAFYASLMLINKFIKNMDGLETTLIQLGIATTLLMPYVFFTEGFGVLDVSGSSIPFIIIIGVVHTGFAYLFFFSGIRKLKGQSIAALSYADPITSLVISAVILHEQTTVVQLLGGALLLGSTFVSENNSMKLSRRKKIGYMQE
ncbi:DMT family transporter [Sporosarcina thermotolerans]|uniref:DMT family transporter n=1 Tax=Sporosarcina thermotolerans TaxID=633404 RepID=A0AAW9ABI7_9BACL|nr:DMT family transporter [Sporosarcina thermotolerans]MDW0116531.1 DMT family transporter [Sporosarcina thermotolerans]WHT48753.1 DMT family transporter [Sporosarcina thermotolerans]